MISWAFYWIDSLLVLAVVWALVAWRRDSRPKPPPLLWLDPRKPRFDHWRD